MLLLLVTLCHFMRPNNLQLTRNGFICRIVWMITPIFGSEKLKDYWWLDIPLLHYLTSPHLQQPRKQKQEQKNQVDKKQKGVVVEKESVNENYGLWTYNMIRWATNTMIFHHCKGKIAPVGIILTHIVNQNKWFKSKPCGEYKKGKRTLGDHQSQIWETMVGGEMSRMCIKDIAEWMNVDNVYRRIVSHCESRWG